MSRRGPSRRRRGGVVRILLAVAAAMLPSGIVSASTVTAPGTPPALEATGEGVAWRPAMVPQRAPRACADRAYVLRPWKWTRQFRWQYQAASTPSGIGRTAARRAVGRGISNITTAHNDCGRDDEVHVSNAFAGITTRAPNITSDGACLRPDGHNVLGFGRLPNLASFTCVWASRGRVIEADIMFGRQVRWTTTLDACADQLLIEVASTVAAGTVFGLGFVSESSHGRLSMSRLFDGYCQDAEATLGLGDMLGLERKY